MRGSRRAPFDAHGGIMASTRTNGASSVSYPISLKGLSVGMAQFYGYIAGQNAAAGK